MTSEVADLIKALRDGTMTLDEVVQRFRKRTWPRRPKRQSGSYEEMAARTMEDPEPHLPDSFDDVTDAYDQGQLSIDEYEVLSEAVAEAKRAEDEREGGGS